MILMVWSNLYNNTISVPVLGCGALNCNVGANINVWQGMCSLIVVLLVGVAALLISDLTGVKCGRVGW